MFLEPAVTPSLRFQVSLCSAFRSMCDVPSTAVFCKEFIGCVPGIACRFFFKLRVTIPVAPIIAGMTVQFSYYYYYYYYYYDIVPVYIDKFVLKNFITSYS